LKKIEGVGPKVASILNDAGITTFQQMVDAGADKLEAILDAAKLQMIDADTWPEQAKLAATGDWEALEKLQDELSGGKRA
jgi:predicted flap endonuclease-1-like 5' DNA nuclease